MGETVVAHMTIDGDPDAPVLRRVRHDESGIESFELSDPVVHDGEPLQMFFTSAGYADQLWQVLKYTAQAYSVRIVNVHSGDRQG